MEQIRKIGEALMRINGEKWLLVSGNILLGLFFIILANVGVLPLDTVHFFFFSFIGFLFALYRPAWAFLLLVGFLPYEAVNLAPEAWGMDLRPYQLAVVLLSLALLARLAMKKLSWKFFRLSWIDILPGIVGIGAFLAVPFAPDAGTALRQAVIVASFGLLYFLLRQFLRKEENIRHIEPFFLGSASVVFAYTIWQSFRMQAGQAAFTTMVGRPNGTFVEADWLGLFAAFIIIFILARVFAHIQKSTLRAMDVVRTEGIFLAVRLGILTLGFGALLLSLSRSAWLGVVAGFGLLLSFAALGVFRKAFPRQTLAVVSGLAAASFFLALASVHFFHLTAFDLSSRAESTASGLKLITISCERETALPESIGTTDELAQYGCRHINLEEKESERALGHSVTEIFRQDPNVSIRKMIFLRSFSLIREHWAFGIGWGNAPLFLGSDERGAGLNTSNMFLEVWLGSGLLGFAAFLLFWFWILTASVRELARRAWGNAFKLLVTRLWGVLTVFNLFNAGLLMALLFLFLALTVLILPKPFQTKKI